MLATLVTWKRPKCAGHIIEHLLEEIGPDDRVMVFDNGGLDNELVLHLNTVGYTFEAWDDLSSITRGHNGHAGKVRSFNCVEDERLTVLVSEDGNIGAGAARNFMLWHGRRDGEGFIRIDDDWVPGEHGWLKLADAMSKLSGLVRLAPEESIEPGRAGLRKGKQRWRLPDTCGPIWVVSGECAEAMGFFDMRYGRTLLDDLLYSRYVVEWNRRRGVRNGVLELGWPLVDLGSFNERGPTKWNPPWDLFRAHVGTLKTAQNLRCSYAQPEPGWAWREAGLEFREKRNG